MNKTSHKNNKKDAKDVREQGLDKFYTIPEYAKKCISTVENISHFSSYDLIVEPSAGNGSFYHQIQNYNQKIGIDISPENDENDEKDGKDSKDENEKIRKQDFFDYYPENGDKKRILVIGNPPFGKVSSIAIKFFNHAATFASTIAFIIPRTFRRPSVQNKLDEMFHLIHDEDVPVKPCCFFPKMMVKCCFQIWERRDTKREKVELQTEHPDWTFLPFGPNDEKGQPTPPVGADFAIRAYGGKIGHLVHLQDELEKLRPKSWHWIQTIGNIGNIDKNTLMSRFKTLDYSDSVNTARQNSMGRGELVRLYRNKYSLDENEKNEEE